MGAPARSPWCWKDLVPLGDALAASRTTGVAFLVSFLSSLPFAERLGAVADGLFLVLIVPPTPPSTLLPAIDQLDFSPPPTPTSLPFSHPPGFPPRPLGLPPRPYSPDSNVQQLVALESEVLDHRMATASLREEITALEARLLIAETAVDEYYWLRAFVLEFTLVVAGSMDSWGSSSLGPAGAAYVGSLVADVGGFAEGIVHGVGPVAERQLPSVDAIEHRARAEAMATYSRSMQVGESFPLLSTRRCLLDSRLIFLLLLFPRYLHLPILQSSSVSSYVSQFRPRHLLVGFPSSRRLLLHLGAPIFRRLLLRLHVPSSRRFSSYLLLLARLLVGVPCSHSRGFLVSFFFLRARLLPSSADYSSTYTDRLLSQGYILSSSSGLFWCISGRVGFPLCLILLPSFCTPPSGASFFLGLYL